MGNDPIVKPQVKLKMVRIFTVCHSTQLMVVLHPIFRKSFDVMRDGLKRLVDLSTPGKCLQDRRRMGRYQYQAALNRDYFDLSSVKFYALSKVT